VSLPPLLLPEVDELRGSGELFARQLHAVDITWRVDIACGFPHGHPSIPPVAALPEIGRTLTLRADALRAGTVP
jgi:acetyl esterase